ncbi:MAG: TolC family protein [Candidatus Methylomirabilales bacterium]
MGCLLALLAFVSPLRAEQERPLTLNEAITLALKQNPELRVERKASEVAQGELLQARIYPFNPELQVEPGFGRGRAFENGGGRFTRGVAINLSQTVEIKGQRGLRIRRAMAGLDQVTWSIQDAERRVLARVARAFNEVLLAQERLKFAGEIVALNQELLRIAKELFEAGAVPRLDVLRAEVELRRAMNQQTAQVRELQAARKELALLLGQPPGFALQAVGPLFYSSLETNLDRLRSLALTLRPDLKVAEAGARVMEAELALVRAERVFPAINISASYEEDREADSRDRRVILGLSIPLPLINRKQGELLISSAERERRAATVDLIRARIEKEVRQAFDRFTLQQQIVEAFVQKILPEQEENFKLIREGYELGQFRLTDVLVAQREFTEGRLEYLSAVLEFNEALADLEEAVGTRLIEAERRS